MHVQVALGLFFILFCGGLYLGGVFYMMRYLCACVFHCTAAAIRPKKRKEIERERVREAFLQAVEKVMGVHICIGWRKREMKCVIRKGGKKIPDDWEENSARFQSFGVSCVSLAPLRVFLPVEWFSLSRARSFLPLAIASSLSLPPRFHVRS